MTGKAQNCAYADGNSDQALFCKPIGICLDSQGNIYVSETINPRIRQVTPDGKVKTIAGTGVNGYSDGVGKAAQFYTPAVLGTSKDGLSRIYIADFFNNRIRMLTNE